MSFGSDSIKPKVGVGLRRLAERASSHARGRGGLGVRSVGGQTLRRPTSPTRRIGKAGGAATGGILAPKVN